MKKVSFLTLGKFSGTAFKYLFFLGLLLNLTPQPVLTGTDFTSPRNFEKDEKLQAVTDALLPLFDKMPPVSVFLSDEQIIKSGTNTQRGVAYTRCENHENPSIFLKKTFYQTANPKQLTNILKHELTHAWLCRQRRMWGHDENFRQKFREVGGFGN